MKLPALKTGSTPTLMKEQLPNLTERVSDVQLI